MEKKYHNDLDTRLRRKYEGYNICDEIQKLESEVQSYPLLAQLRYDVSLKEQMGKHYLAPYTHFSLDEILEKRQKAKKDTMVFMNTWYMKTYDKTLKRLKL